MSASGKVEKLLQLPKGIHNISAKPFTSSECLLSADESVAVTGLRKILYIWSTASCELIHSFQAHLGRINKMVALAENGSNCMVTSSVDKVWNDSINLLPKWEIRLEFGVNQFAFGNIYSLFRPSEFGTLIAFMRRFMLLTDMICLLRIYFHLDNPERFSQGQETVSLSGTYTMER